MESWDTIVSSIREPALQLVLVLLVVACLLWAWLSRRKRERRTVLHVAESVMAKMCSHRWERKVKRLVQTLYLPGRQSSIVLFAFATLILILGWVRRLGMGDPIALPWDFRSNSAGSVAGDVLVGIATALFALSIFMAEALRDSGRDDTGRVLLKASWIYPVTVAVLGALLLLFFLDASSPIAVILIISVGFLVIRAFHVVIGLLINRTRLRAGRLALLSDRLKEFLEQSILQRIAHNLYLKELGATANLEYNPFVADRDKDKWYAVRAWEDGRVADIDLDALRRLDDGIGKQLPTDLPPPKELGASAAVGGSSENRPEGERSGRIGVILGERLTKGETALLYVRKRPDGREDDRRNVEALAKRVVIVGPRKAKPSDEREEYGDLYTQSVKAIREGDERGLEFAAEAYGEAVALFLEGISQCGAGYAAAEDAAKELYGMGGGWASLETPVSDVASLVEVVAEYGDRHAAREIVGIAYHYASMAIEKRDLYVLERAFTVMAHACWASLKFRNGTGPTTDMLFDRSWRYLTEIARYRIVKGIEEGEKEETVRFNHQAMEAVLRTYQRLIRTAVQHRRQDRLEELLKHTEFIPSDLIRELVSDKQEREFAQRTQIEADKKNEAQLALIDAKILSLRDLARAVHEMLLALAGYQLEAWARTRTGASVQLQKQLAEQLLLVLPRDRIGLTEAYLSARSIDRQDAWRWSQWEMEEKMDGHVHAIQTDDKLDLAYAVAMLRSLETGQRVVDEALPPTLDLAYLVEKADGALVRLFQEIERDKEVWKELVSEDQLARIGEVLAALRTAAAEYRKQEERDIADRAPDDSKLQDFRGQLVDMFLSSVTIRALFREFARSKRSKIIFQDDAKALGISTLYPKEAFFKDWHVHYMQFGRDFGRTLATGEDRELLESIANAIPNRIRASSGPELAEIILRETRALVTPSTKGRVIALLGGMLRLEHGPFEIEMHTPAWRLRTDQDEYSRIAGFEGVVSVGRRRVPVFRITGRERPKLVLMKLPSFGVLVEKELSGGSGWEDAMAVEGLLVRIRDLNQHDELRARILGQSDDWPGSTTAEREDYLRRQVVIDVRVGSIIEAKKPEGVVIECEAPPEGSTT